MNARNLGNGLDGILQLSNGLGLLHMTTKDLGLLKQNRLGSIPIFMKWVSLSVVQDFLLFDDVINRMRRTRSLGWGSMGKHGRRSFRTSVGGLVRDSQLVGDRLVRFNLDISDRRMTRSMGSR